jgi:pimeloyl-ACP methyl ester carboxylesterase
MQSSINREPARWGVSAVYTHPLAKADIVLVHGLNGHPEKTWKAKDDKTYWPVDLLPASLRDEHANVLVYGYNADVFSTAKDHSPNDNFTHQQAETLVADLTQFRINHGTKHRPIIWVVHSYGGILTKSALLYSEGLNNDKLNDHRLIRVCTYGIVFLGTPHAGSDIAAWGRVLQFMAGFVPRKWFDSEPVLLKTLKRDSETLMDINSRFTNIINDFHVHMVHENHKTDIKGTKYVSHGIVARSMSLLTWHRVKVVDSQSAGPRIPGVAYYGIEADHTTMCRFDSENAPGYVTVSTAIRTWVGTAGPDIERRVRKEQDLLEEKIKWENSERMRPFVSAATTWHTYMYH